MEGLHTDTHEERTASYGSTRKKLIRAAVNASLDCWNSISLMGEFAPSEEEDREAEQYRNRCYAQLTEREQEYALELYEEKREVQPITHY